MHIDNTYRKNASQIIASWLMDSGVFSQSQANQVTSWIIGFTAIHVWDLLRKKQSQTSRDELQKFASWIAQLIQSKIPDINLDQKKLSLLMSTIRFHTVCALSLEDIEAERPDQTPRGQITADILMGEVHPGATIELCVKDEDEDEDVFWLFSDVDMSSIHENTPVTEKFTWIGIGKGKKGTFAVLRAQRGGHYLLWEHTLLDEVLIFHRGASTQPLPDQVYLESPAIQIRTEDIGIIDRPLQICQSLGRNFFIVNKDEKIFNNHTDPSPVMLYRNTLTGELIILLADSIEEEEKKAA